MNMYKTSIFIFSSFLIKGCCFSQCVKVNPVDNYYVLYNNQNKYINVEFKYNKQNYVVKIPPKKTATYYFKKSEKWKCAEDLKINGTIFIKNYIPHPRLNKANYFQKNQCKHVVLS